MTSSYPERFSHILAAAASEYGCTLVLSERVHWSDVSTEIREGIVARAESR